VKHDDRSAVLERLEADAETTDRLDALVETLERWAPRINLVARSTLDAVWTRHVEDSAQILRYAPVGARRWIDLGAGAGFPGLVVAALAASRVQDLAVTLVESDARKAAFLSAAARAMGVEVDIRISRIEALSPEPFDVVSARALASLPKLLDYASPLLAQGGVAMFPKGEGWRSELTEARRHWHMEVDVRPSVTHRDAVILVLSEIARE
jgi:16S rRNA (guanine527-N7)-methyltransferase